MKYEQFELLYIYIYILPETLLTYKKCYNKANWNTEKRQYNIGMMFTYDAGRLMEIVYVYVCMYVYIYIYWYDTYDAGR